MKTYAIYGVGGLLSISLLFFGTYTMSSVVGNVSYVRAETQSASAITTVSAPTLDDTDTSKNDIAEDEAEEVVDTEEELVPAIEEAPEPEPEPEPVVEEVDTAAVAALQEQVKALLDEVAKQTESLAAVNTESTNDESEYFVTPNGTKIDSNGNVVTDSPVQESEPVEVSTQTTQQTQSSLPSGYFRLPSGAVMGPGGVIVNESDITQATQVEEQQQTTSLDYFITPSGEKIDRYGNIIE